MKFEGSLITEEGGLRLVVDHVGVTSNVDGDRVMEHLLVEDGGCVSSAIGSAGSQGPECPSNSVRTHSASILTDG